MTAAPLHVADVEVIQSDIEFGDDFELRDDLVSDLIDRLGRTAVDDRDALAAFRPDADEDQTRVIAAVGNTIRVIAPAGSGKTQTMVNRLLAQASNGVRPERMLVLTFDNAAVQSLRSKLTATLEAHDFEPHRFHISTLNAFGYGVLGQTFPNEHKPIIERQRAWALMREVRDSLRTKDSERAAALPDDLDNRFYLDFFAFLKNQTFDPRQFVAQQLADFILKARQAEPFFQPTFDQERIRFIIQSILWLYRAFEATFQREGRIDFDDQKLRALMCLRANPAALKALQSRFAEVIVDEFQDINRLDFEFIAEIAKQATLVVCGDDDQAIYGFRGCSPDYIINLPERLQRPVEAYELRVNYRCPPNIVEKADKLIRHNTNRVDKNPIAFNKEPASIKVVQSNSSAIEARLIISFVSKIKTKNPALRFSDFAVLYRTNAQSLPLQIHFILNNIPYFVREEDNILTNEILERLLAVLRIKLSLADGGGVSADDAVLAVKAYFRHVPDRVVPKLHAFFTREPDFVTAVNSPKLPTVFKSAGNSNFPKAMADVLAAKSLVKALDVMAQSFKGLRGMIGSLEDAVDQKVSLGEVYELAASFRGRLKDFVATVGQALEEARATSAGHDRENGVALLTYFKAKGLQWHTVILTSCNEKLIPHHRAPVEDERRLFYVAMTRASSNLFISHLKKACSSPVAPSRFLFEAELLTDGVQAAVS